MEKQCLKCKHVAQVQSAAEPCPKCGAIYEKVETYLAQQREGAERPPLQRSSSSNSSPSSRYRQRAQDREDYIITLRNESLYPTTRWWVNIVYLALCAVVALIGVGAVGGAILSKSILPAFIGATVAAIVWLGARIGKELAIMGIDLCDAGVRTAYLQETAPQR